MPQRRLTRRFANVPFRAVTPSGSRILLYLLALFVDLVRQMRVLLKPGEQ